MRGHEHGCLIQRFQDAFRVIATISNNMLMKTLTEVGFRVINRFRACFRTFFIPCLLVLVHFWVSGRTFLL